MIEILGGIAFVGIVLFLTITLTKGYEEAKKEGYIYDGKNEER